MADCDVPSTVSLVSSLSLASCGDPIPSSSQTSTSQLSFPSTSSAMVPRFGISRFPVRIGITWKKGEKLEAMDFSRTWYPSKIVEIDDTAKCVLIHFEGWNQRYDEWVPMDSEKLRPVTRHSERKDKGVKKRRIHPHPIYRAGEKVLAKWTDCKKYPAKISRLKEDGMYEVTFFDGVTRLIQPMNIQPLPEGMQDLKTLPPENCPAPRTKLSFKQIKVTLPDSVKRVKEKLGKSQLVSDGLPLDKNIVPDETTPLDDGSRVSNVSVVLENIRVPGASLEKDKLPAKRRILQKKKFRLKKSVHTLTTNTLAPSLESSSVNTAFRLALDWNPPVKRRVGRPKSAWRRTLEEEARATGTTWAELKKARQNSHRATWAVTALNFKGNQEDKSTFPARTSKKRPYSWRIRKFKKLPVEFSHIDDALPAQAESPKVVKPATGISVIPVTTTSSTPSAMTITAPSRKSLTVKDTLSPDLLQTEALAAIAVQTWAQTPSCSTQEPHIFGSKRTKKRSSTVPSLQSKHKKMRSKSKVEGVRSGGLTKRPPMLSQVDRAKSLDAGSNIAASPSARIALPMPVFVPSKAFIVEEDHNPFKCPHQGCNKDFRKENLLAYHIKYYHTDTEAATSVSDVSVGVTSPLLPPASLQSPGGSFGSRKRRKKTSSICSTDSDVSISSKGRSSSRRPHHDYDVSVNAAASPDVLSRDLWADVKPSHTSQDGINEDNVAVDTEDEDMEADVVNCVCGQRETNGLMIQCDVCMCWQHFACTDTNNSGVPPINYVCRVCENTPGIRDSCRYMYDMGWERRGELPSFPFSNESSSEHLRSVACECNDMTSALLAIKSALHSTRRQIKITKEEADPEFQLWQTDWDNWTKPEEDLTLTPRSGDHDPSPTPSTFLFPQAPCSNTAISTAEVLSLAALASSAPLLQSLTVMSHVSTADKPPISAVSSSQISHFTSSVTSTLATTTIEVTSVLESPPMSSQPSKPPQLTEASTSTITLPSGSSPTGSQPSGCSSLLMLPQTASVGQSNSLPSIHRQAGNSIRDLLPGHAADSFQSSKGECVSSRTESSTQRTENGHLSPVDEEFTAESNNSDSQKLLPLSGSRQFLGTSATSQPQVRTLPALSNLQAVHHGIISQLKYNSQDTQLKATSAVFSTGPDAAMQTDQTGRQDQVSLSAHSHDDKIALTSKKESAVCDSNNHMSSLYVEVSGSQGLHAECHDDDADDAADNDTDTAEESLDPYRNCEHNLLVHVSRVHSDIEKQLELLEQQIAELENSEHNNPTVQLSEDNVLNDVPALKKSLGKLYRNLVKVQRFCVHH